MWQCSLPGRCGIFLWENLSIIKLAMFSLVNCSNNWTQVQRNVSYSLHRGNTFHLSLKHAFNPTSSLLNNISSVAQSCPTLCDPMDCSTHRHTLTYMHEMHQFSSVQSLSHVRLFATPWIAARQASLSITNSQSLLKLMCIELVMPSSYLILCLSLLRLPPIPPSIRVFSNESTLCIWWPKY